MSQGLIAIAAYLGVYTTCVLIVPKENDAVRAAAVAVIGTAAAAMYKLASVAGLDSYTLSTVAMLLCTNSLSLSEFLLFTKVDQSDLARLSARRKNEPGIISKTWQALCLVCNMRRIGTPWQAKNVSAALPQSRSKFVARNLAVAVLEYLLVDAIEILPMPPAHYLQYEQQTLRFWTLSTSELAVRVLVTARFWLSTYYWLRIMTRLLAVITVSMHVSSPQAWPPLNGSVTLTYTVRKFWSDFWHQCLRKLLTGISDGFVDALQFLPRGTMASRYVRLSVAFLISGAIHHFIDMAMAIAPSDAGSFEFFLAQALAIMLEDYVQYATESTSWLSTRSRRLIGYVWVAGFLCLVTPVWFYPQARLADYIGFVPQPVIGPLVNKMISAGAHAL